MTTTHLDIAIAAARYVHTGDFGALRRTIAGPRNRECGPYYYAVNTSVRRQRAAGTVALRVRDAAVALGMQHELYSTGSWAGKWPRTVCSMRAEREGSALFARAVAYCAAALAQAGDGEEVRDAA